MPFDADAGKSAHLASTETPATEREAARGAKPLGRGLESVSHLFLSARTEPPTAEPAGGRETDADRARPHIRRGTAVLRPRDGLTRQLLAATLQECQSALEDGLTSVDADVPCPTCGEIDVLALDGGHQPLVIDIEIGTAGDALLVRGLCHLDWVRQNATGLRRTYPDLNMRGLARPRLFLVARHFPAHLKHAVRQITEPAVACFTYRGVELSGGVGVFFERVAVDED
jgi:hypothetical protein